MHATLQRPPAVAGLFYPDDPDRLRADVTRYTEDAARSSDPTPPKALIAPHAGYPYSGPIAGSAYAAVRTLRGTVRRVVLFSPSHCLGFRGIAATAADAFLTPLGPVPIDRSAVADICASGLASLRETAHRDEHGIEVHLPFLQVILDPVLLIPLVVGDEQPTRVAEAMEHLWGGPETLIVVSSDLSHYLSYAAARALDQQTTEAILAGDATSIAPDQACGRTPLSALLQQARRHALRAEALDVRSSGDTAGDRSRVVGYGAYAFRPT
jgi:AmmeMemoRadiSam system protein B